MKIFHFILRIFRFGRSLNKCKGINLISFTIEIKFQIREVYRNKWTFIPARHAKLQINTLKLLLLISDYAFPLAKQARNCHSN